MMQFISHWPAAKEHFILFLIAWGTFSLLLGLSLTFDDLERAGKNIASAAILHGFQTAGLVMLGGIVTLTLLLWAIRRRP